MISLKKEPQSDVTITFPSILIGCCILHNNVPFFINSQCSDKRIQQRNSRKQDTTGIQKTSACCLEVSSLRFDFYLFTFIHLHALIKTQQYILVPTGNVNLSDHFQNSERLFFAIHNICCCCFKLCIIVQVIRLLIDIVKHVMWLIKIMKE